MNKSAANTDVKNAL